MSVHTLMSRFLKAATPARVEAPITAPALSPRQALNIRYFTDFPTCNLSCSYCIAGHGTVFAKPANNWSEERYDAIIGNIAKLDYDINIRIGVGGEFFVSKVLIDGARRLSNADNLASLNLITNLTLSVKQYDKIFQGFRTEKLAVVASFHPEQIKNHEDWFAKAAEFGRRFDFSVIMVAFPEFLDRLEAWKGRLNALGVSVFIQPFIGPYENKNYPRDYSEEERALIKRLIYSRHDWEYLLEVKRPGLCNAGHKSIYIDPFGKVVPCGMGPYKASLGNLAESAELSLRATPAPCPFRACQCDTENINVVDFENHYEKTDKNQHRYAYRFAELAAFDARYDEWAINY